MWWCQLLPVIQGRYTSDNTGFNTVMKPFAQCQHRGQNKGKWKLKMGKRAAKKKGFSSLSPRDHTCFMVTEGPKMQAVGFYKKLLTIMPSLSNLK